MRVPRIRAAFVIVFAIAAAIGAVGAIVMPESWTNLESSPSFMAWFWGGHTMNEIERIAQQIESGYRDGAWPGVPVRDLLRSLTAADAAEHPIPSAHSAWEIALHIGFWHDAVRRRLRGDPADYAPEEDWPAPAEPTEANWKFALDAIDRGHSSLVAAVRELEPARLGDIVPGKEFTVYFMLHGVPQHDLYHGGQVVLLKKLLGDR